MIYSLLTGLQDSMPMLQSGCMRGQRGEGGMEKVLRRANVSKTHGIGYRRSEKGTTYLCSIDTVGWGEIDERNYIKRGGGGTLPL